MKQKKRANLYLIEVQPLVRGLREPSITYFSSDSYNPGSVILVPFRTGERTAIVLSVKPIADAKAEIKSIGFSLRKIKQQNARTIFLPRFLSAVEILADYYATYAGDILTSLTPTAMLDPESVSKSKDIVDKVDSKRKYKTTFIQGDPEFRFQKYKKLINKSLLKGLSIVVLVPTVEDARSLSVKLKEEFGEVVFELSSRLTKKKQIESWNAIATSKESLVVVMTSGFLSLPILNAGIFIIDRCGSSQFFGLKRPYLDARVVAKKVASEYGARLILGDILIPLDQLGISSNFESEEVTNIDAGASVEIVDMTSKTKGGDLTSKPLSGKKSDFKLVSDKLLLETRSALAENKNVFWFVARRGLFPSTICRDCGTEHACEKCGATLVLHEKNNERVFLCHRCGHKEGALTTCKVCGSWRLEPLGIGVDRVFKEAQKEFSDPIIISADQTSTKTKIRSSIKDFYSSNTGRLLIGTDLALPFLEAGVDLVGVISLDSRLSLPLYNAEESALRTLLMITSLSEHRSLIQTRRPDHRVFKTTSVKKLTKFRKEEMVLRETFSYPPFGVMISLTINKERSEADRLRDKLAESIKPLIKETEKILLPPLRGTKKRGVYSATIILKLEKNLLETAGLREFIRSLPSSVIVRVEPENLW